MTTVHPSSEGYFQHVSHHVTKLKSSQTRVLNMTMTNDYTHGQISIQQSTFGLNQEIHIMDL